MSLKPPVFELNDASENLPGIVRRRIQFNLRVNVSDERRVRAAAAALW
jgi:hypothetical protein